MMRVVAPGACRRFLSAAAQSSRRPPPPLPPARASGLMSGVGGGWALSVAAQSSRRPPSPPPSTAVLSAAAQSSRRRPPPPQATSLGFSTSSASSAAASPVHREVRTGAPADSSAAAAGQVPKASETGVGYLKRMMFVKGIMTLVGLLFSLVVAFGFSDTAFLVWRLNHPVLPDLSLPQPHVDTSKAEDELLVMMNDSPQFVVVFGIPGCGKTTTILSAAKRRGKAVFYYSMGTGGSLKALEEKIQKEYGAMFPSLHELVRGTGGATVWDRLTVAGNVWRRWLCSDASSSLVIILDNLNKLDERDLYSIASIGKCARDENSFSVWLVLSEEQGLGILIHQSDALTRARGYNLPSIPEEELVRFVDSALGSHGKITTDLAERYVYLVGSSLTHLWQLVDATKQRTVERNVLPHLTRRKPRCQPLEDQEAKDFFKKFLDAREKVGLEEVPSTADWSCLQPQGNVVKIRNRWCRDVISLQVAEREVTDAEREVTSAKDRVTAAKREIIAAKREIIAAQLEVTAATDRVIAAKDRVTAAKDRVTAAKNRVTAWWWWKVVVPQREAARQKDAGNALEEALETEKQAGNLLTNAVEEREGARKLLQEALRKQEEARKLLQEALRKQEEARTLRDQAAKVVSTNTEAVYHAVSTFYKTMAPPLPTKGSTTTL